jgi:hypothetical protein
MLITLGFGADVLKLVANSGCREVRLRWPVPRCAGAQAATSEQTVARPSTSAFDEPDRVVKLVSRRTPGEPCAGRDTDPASPAC